MEEFKKEGSVGTTGVKTKVEVIEKQGVREEMKEEGKGYEFMFIKVQGDIGEILRDRQGVMDELERGGVIGSIGGGRDWE